MDFLFPKLKSFKRHDIFIYAEQNQIDKKGNWKGQDGKYHLFF